MDAQLFILTRVHEAFRRLRLDDEIGCPTWSDRAFFRACRLRLQPHDRFAWNEFVNRLHSDVYLAHAVRSVLLEQAVLVEISGSDEVKCNLPDRIRPLPWADEKSFLRLLNSATERDLLLPSRSTEVLNDAGKGARTEIMYVESKQGLTGHGRIGRVRFSKSVKTIYYADKKVAIAERCRLQS
jgi:hypothetical protein